MTSDEAHNDRAVEKHDGERCRVCGMRTDREGVDLGDDEEWDL